MHAFVSAVRLPSPALFSYGCEIYDAKQVTAKYCICRQQLPWLEAEEDQADVLGVC